MCKATVAHCKSHIYIPLERNESARKQRLYSALHKDDPKPGARDNAISENIYLVQRARPLHVALSMATAQRIELR